MTDFSPILDAIEQDSVDNAELRRLFHGRGHTVPALSHINLDFYPPVLFLVSYDELSEEEQATLTAEVWHTAKAHFGDALSGLVFQQRRLGERAENRLAFGELPEQHTVCELGIEYQVNLMSGQNTGIFPDMRPGREFVLSHSRHAKVLNLFSYTCGFSLAAMKGGADQVVNMDMNKGVLRTGKNNHLLNGFANGVSYLPHDILKSFGKLKKLAPFDLIVVDPPSFQKGSFILTKDYQKILRRLPELVHENTLLLLCANCPEMPEQVFRELIREHAGEAFAFVERLPAAPGFTEVNPDRSLKALIYKAG